MSKKAPLFVVMGVSGSGKTSVGRALAGKLLLPFKDADDYHPVENIDKMAAGIPLEDSDRWPWLAQLHALLKAAQFEEGMVLACSALKEAYRDYLRKGLNVKDEEGEGLNIHWIYLEVAMETLRERLSHREHHFFNPSLLQSQFDTLEVPEYGLHIQPADTIAETVEAILTKMSYE